MMDNIHFTEVVRNLSWARAVWRRISPIISKEESMLQLSVLFFKDVVQAVLLFVSETWVVTPYVGKALGGFQDQVARALTGCLPCRTPDRNFIYTSAVTA